MPGTVPRGSFQIPRGNIIAPVGLAILDKLDRGLVLMDSKGRVVDTNALAARVLRSCDGFTLRAGRLAFADPALDERMIAAIERHRQGARGGRTVLAARVRCDGDEPCRIVVSHVPANDDARDVAFFAMIYVPNGQHRITQELLCEMYGLTRAQADVARSLFEGRSVEATARALSLSPNTVRTHLKGIFERCEVKSQAELLHLLALGPVDL